MRAISRISWFDSYRYNNICRSSNYAAILLFFFLQAAFLSQQSSHKYRGPFFLSPSLLVYKDTNLRNYGDPAHNKERNLTTTFHNVEEVAVQQKLCCHGRTKFNPGSMLHVICSLQTYTMLLMLAWRCAGARIDFCFFISLSAVAFM